MAALPTSDDLTHLDEPRTYREMFQKIMVMMQADRDDRADDRDMLEGFITRQEELNKTMNERVKHVEECTIEYGEAIKTLKETSKKWDITNTLLALGAALAAFFGLKGS